MREAGRGRALWLGVFILIRRAGRLLGGVVMRMAPQMRHHPIILLLAFAHHVDAELLDRDAKMPSPIKMKIVVKILPAAVAGTRLP